ncbi:MAG TPA: GNAT family N-acetyltransferase [Pseudonocardiaceae bacterium]
MTTMSLREVSLARVEPGDEQALAQWYELRCAVARADQPDDPPPCPIFEHARFHHPWPGEAETAWLARVAGSVVGGCVLYLPMLDNLDKALGDVLVAPAHRRGGIGRALLDHLRAEAGRQCRNSLVFGVDQPLDPAAPDPAGRFAAASGAVPALFETRRRLSLAEVDSAALVRLEEQARDRSRGYSVVQWVGDTPHQWLEGMAYLTARMIIDAPLDDLRWDPEVYDAARMQACDASCLARGLHLVTTAAVDGTGRLVAFTRLAGHATSRWFAGQADTIVDPVHRGHRLGMLIKLANLKLARTQRPELRVIDTCNADSTPYMVRINEAIGFRPHRRSVAWQLLGSWAQS